MNNAEIVLDGNSLTIEQVISVSNFNTKVRLSNSSISTIKNSRNLVENIISSGDVVYGINTCVWTWRKDGPQFSLNDDDCKGKFTC